MDQNNTEDQSTNAPQQESTPASDTHMNSTQNGDSMNNSKMYAIIGYILPFLFFLPLVQDSLKKNEYSRFHANQQLILLIMWVGLYVLQQVLYMMFFAMVYALVPLLNLALLVLAIMGIISAAQGTMKELPLVGGFKVLK